MPAESPGFDLQSAPCPRVLGGPRCADQRRGEGAATPCPGAEVGPHEAPGGPARSLPYPDRKHAPRREVWDSMLLLKSRPAKCDRLQLLSAPGGLAEAAQQVRATEGDARSANTRHVTASPAPPPASAAALAEITGPMKTKERGNKNIAGSGCKCLPSLGNPILDHSVLTWGQLLLSLMRGGKSVGGGGVRSPNAVGSVWGGRALLPRVLFQADETRLCPVPQEEWAP